MSLCRILQWVPAMEEDVPAMEEDQEIPDRILLNL